jgi:hypothetical protein
LRSCTSGGPQREFLEAVGAEVSKRAFNGRDSVDPIRTAVSSGHGIGKSTIQAWLVDWHVDPDARQGHRHRQHRHAARDQTWAAIRGWTRLCLTGHWFVLNSQRASRSERLGQALRATEPRAQRRADRVDMMLSSAATKIFIGRGNRGVGRLDPGQVEAASSQNTGDSLAEGLTSENDVCTRSTPPAVTPSSRTCVVNSAMVIG